MESHISSLENQIKALSTQADRLIEERDRIVAKLQATRELIAKGWWEWVPKSAGIGNDEYWLMEVKDARVIMNLLGLEIRKAETEK